MAQAQTTQREERAAKGASAAPPVSAPRPVEGKRVPGLSVTMDPRWALGFLARMYTKAHEHKVLNTLSGWIEPDSRSLRTVFNPARNAPFAHRATRDMIVRDVVTDLIAWDQLPATTSRDAKDLRMLSERETGLGNSLIEAVAVNGMSTKLVGQRQRVPRLLIDPYGMPALMEEAARHVVARVADRGLVASLQKCLRASTPDAEKMKEVLQSPIDSVLTGSFWDGDPNCLCVPM